MTTKQKQTRWVKCSERMPTQTGKYLFLRVRNGRIEREFMWWDIWPVTVLYGWDAWLENLPEYVP